MFVSYCGWWDFRYVRLFCGVLIYDYDLIGVVLDGYVWRHAVTLC